MKTFTELFEPKPKGEREFYSLHNPERISKVDPKTKKVNDDEFNAGNVKTFDRAKYRYGAKPEQDANSKPCDGDGY